MPSFTSRCAQNSSDESTPVTGAYIDLEDPYRKGGPGRLPPHPVPRAISPDISPPQAQELLGEVFRRCISRGIGRSANMQIRHNYGSEPRLPEDITVLKIADISTNIDGCWVTLINEILELFNQKGFHGRIEISDPIAARGEWLFTLGQDNALIPVWGHLEPKLLSILGTTDWVTMVPLRLGYSEDMAETTVIITTNDPNSMVWKDTVKLLRHKISNENLNINVGVEIQGTAGLWGAFTGNQPVSGLAPIPEEVFSPDCPNPMGIGVGCHHNPQTGTMGGFIRLQNGQGYAATVGLTCHHVVVKDDEGYPLPKDVNQNGCKNLPSRLNGEYKADIPTKKQLSDAIDLTTRGITHAKTAISQNPTTTTPHIREMHAKQSQKLNALNNHPSFGRVLATSGFRSVRSEGAVWAMDWALIEPTNGRVCSNATWWAPEITGKLPLASHSLSSISTVHETGSLFEMSATKRPVMKRGCITGLTVGRVNDLNLSARMDGWPAGVPNQAYVVTPGTSTTPVFPMAVRGDSGSWLVDENGKLLGVVQGGDMVGGSAFVIPIDDIFEDIKRITGYTADLNMPIDNWSIW